MMRDTAPLFAICTLHPEGSACSHGNSSAYKPRRTTISMVKCLYSRVD